jgi:hypothetical protein
MTAHTTNQNATKNSKTRIQSVLQCRSLEPTCSEEREQASFGTEGKIPDAVFGELPQM